MTRKHDVCVVLGNGPSLTGTLENNSEQLKNYDLIAVNFFAISPEYVKYRPEKYVLCDPAFWYDRHSEELFMKVDHFYKTMEDVTYWPLQLYLPYQAKKCNKIFETLGHNTQISICFYNKTKYEGWGQRFIYSSINRNYCWNGKSPDGKGAL